MLQYKEKIIENGGMSICKISVKVDGKVFLCKNCTLELQYKRIVCSLGKFLIN